MNLIDLYNVNLITRIYKTTAGGLTLPSFERTILTQEALERSTTVNRFSKFKVYEVDFRPLGSNIAQTHRFSGMSYYLNGNGGQ